MKDPSQVLIIKQFEVEFIDWLFMNQTNTKFIQPCQNIEIPKFSTWANNTVQELYLKLWLEKDLFSGIK